MQQTCRYANALSQVNLRAGWIGLTEFREVCVLKIAQVLDVKLFAAVAVRPQACSNLPHACILTSVARAATSLVSLSRSM